MTFSNYEKIVINTLYRTGRPLTTSEVALYSNISRITATKYLNKLYRKGYLRTKLRGNSRYWRIK